MYVQHSEWAFIQEICYIYLRMKDVSVAKLLLLLMDFFYLEIWRDKNSKFFWLVSQLNYILSKFYFIICLLFAARTFL